MYLLELTKLHFALSYFLFAILVQFPKFMVSTQHYYCWEWTPYGPVTYTHIYIAELMHNKWVMQIALGQKGMPTNIWSQILVKFVFLYLSISFIASTNYVFNAYFSNSKEMMKRKRILSIFLYTISKCISSTISIILRLYSIYKDHLLFHMHHSSASWKSFPFLLMLP